MDKIAGILLISLLAIVLAVSLSYYILNQPNQTQNNPSPTPPSTPLPTPTPSPSETPTEPSATTNPSVPEFTLNYVQDWYYVPPELTYITDPYTNETTLRMIPGRHGDNKTIEAIINNNIGASYYNFRYKGHYGDEWSYYPFDPDSGRGYNFYDAFSVPFQASNSSYTVVSLYFLPTLQEGDEVDIQVQALFGDFDAEPFGHLLPTEPTYDFHFTGTTSDWSETQTVTIS